MGLSVRSLLLVITCCFWMGQAFAASSSTGAPQQNPSPTSTSKGASPSIQVSEATYDFGEALEGAEILHEYLVKNTGQGVLLIDQVRPGCGCTAAHFDRTILPGAVGKVTLKLSLRGYQGKVKKTTTVFSNDPQNPRLVLTMEGTVKSLIDLRPTNNVFFRGMADQLTEKVIDIVSTSQPFHIAKVESNLEDKVGYSMETVSDGKHYKLKVTNRIRQGNYIGFIKLFTDHPQKPDIIIRVSGYIEGEIAVKPQTILVGKLATQQPMRLGKVVVINNRNKPFKITKLAYDNKLIQVNQQPLPKDQGYSLEVSPVLEHIPLGTREQTWLTIETDAAPGEKHEVQVHVINSVENPNPEGSSGLPDGTTKPSGAANGEEERPQSEKPSPAGAK